ncbi:DUF1942 domain-containing protein [Rhodococcus kroppenstedtii]|uniref:DUF1942 domain-containing protein n=1 Tax=Rhodococcoides kroppenstedtii TaxID=293050 RepID=UPI0029540316|nr:DUF1942 domain-containing protein [Rhodococcus kroppenstedtii]MDV7198951.1 DUF1942 domain-containing protein [Rhodococcus kroppenstedtii]
MSATVLAFLAVAVTGCGHVVDESDGGGRVGTATGRQTAAVAPLEDAAPFGATQIVDDGGVRTRVTVEGLSPAQPSVYGFPVAGDLQQITVTVEVVDGATSVNPLYFTARASDGTAYGAALGTVDGQLLAETVSAGDRIKGVVAFDVTGPPITSIRYSSALGEELARWVGQSVPGESAAPVPRSASGQGRTTRGDLDLATPMTVPSCDGTGIVVLYSATAPGSYEQEVSEQLSRNSGAQYLRTDNSCSSLRQATAEGNAIYAVYRVAGRTKSEVCAAVGAAGGGAYGKWLDETTDPSYIIPC